MSTKSPKPKSNVAKEFFSLVDGRRDDTKLHESILENGDHQVAEAQSREIMKKAGLTAEQIKSLLGEKS